MHLTLAAAEFAPFINGWKLLPMIVLLLPWARLMTWADKDAVRAHMKREAVNGITVGTLVIALACFFFIPNYFIGLGVYVFIMLAVMGSYLAYRNSKVGLADLKKDFNTWLASLRGKKSDAQLSKGEIIIFSKSGNVIEPAEDQQSPEYAAYHGVQNALDDPLRKQADRIELVPTDSNYRLRYDVDGVTYEGQSFDQNVGANAVQLVKQAAGMDVEEKRRPQKGKLKIKHNELNSKHELDLTVAGNKLGQTLNMEIDFNKRYTRRLNKEGFTADQLEHVMTFMNEGKGLCLVAAPKTQGLTSLLYALIRDHDAFLQHIQTIELRPSSDLEGITQNSFDGNATSEAYAKQMNWLASQEPDVVMLDRVPDRDTAKEIVAFAKTGKKIYAGMRVASVADALQQWRSLVGNDKDAYNTLGFVISARVVRLLCDACKIEYVPDPAVMKKLNLSPDRVKTLFQARTEPMLDNRGNPVPCTFCHTIGYLGRTGVFEVLPMTDDIRTALMSSDGSAGALKTVFRKNKLRYMQESALGLVEQGRTSVQEVLRVMKAAQAAADPPGRPPGGKPPAEVTV